MNDKQYKSAVKTHNWSKLQDYFWETFVFEELTSPSRLLARDRWDKLTEAYRDCIENCF